MALLAVLAGDRGLEARLAYLLESHHSLALSHSWGGLNRVVRERPVTGALVNLEAVPTYPAREGVLAGLRHLYPHLGLVLLLPRSLDPFVLFHLGRAGIGNLVLLPTENLKHELPRTLARAGKGGATSLVLRTLSPHLPPRELHVVRLAMDSVHLRLSAEALAEEVGLTRPHLSERLKGVGLPSAGHFLLWTKLLHAGHWLEEPGRTGESVSRQLEYSSGAAFRRALRLYTGATPTQVREEGGIRLVLDRFLLQSSLGALGRIPDPPGEAPDPGGGIAPSSRHLPPPFGYLHSS